MDQPGSLQSPEPTKCDRLHDFFASILSGLDDRLLSIEPLASGSSADVYKLFSGNGRYALRLFKHRPNKCGLEVDCFVRRLLKSQGQSIAGPIASSLDFGEFPQGQAWVLDEFVGGTHPERRRIPLKAARSLGQFLGALHAIPVDGFGSPSDIRDSTIVAEKQTPLDGVLARFDNPIPQNQMEFAAHPLIASAPQCADFVRKSLDRLGQRLGQSRAALCHTDLHEGQLLCVGDRLAAVLDLGDATLLDPLWDFGSIAYFHGKAVLDAVVRGYTDDELEQRRCRQAGWHFSIGIAMHHASRSRLPGKTHRLRAAQDHIFRCMETRAVAGYRS